jgi:hypothetical protein
MERGEVYRGFWWGNMREKRPLGRPGRRLEDNIKVDLQKVGWGDMDWINLAQDKCGNKPSDSTKCGEFLTSSEPVSCSRSTLLDVVSI